MTLEEKVKVAEKYLGWLKNKYPMKHATIETKYYDVKYLRGTSNVHASFRQEPGLKFTIEIAAAGDESRIVRSMGHEFKHICQIMFEQKFYARLNDKDEIAATLASIDWMREYVEEVGDDWK